MNLPKTIRILGLPFAIKYADVVERGDPNVMAEQDIQRLRLLVASGVHEERKKYYLFWNILEALDRITFRGECDLSAEECDALHAAVWTLLRDNAQTFLRWFGGGEPREGETIRVQGFTYTVTRPTLCANSAEDTLGQCHFRTLMIEVQAGLSRRLASVTGLHESLHAALSGIGTLTEREPVITLVSNLLGQIFFDNPAVLRWMLS